MSEREKFLKRYGGQRCGRCGETVGATDQAHAALEAVIRRDARERAESGNYVANAEMNPTRVLFGNGRTVRIVKGALVVGWARAEADKVFRPAQGSNK